MKPIRHFKYILLTGGLIIGLSLTTSSCAKKIYNVTHEVFTDGQYDTEFPAANCAEQIATLSQAIKLLNSIAYYKQYVFPDTVLIRLKDIDRAYLQRYAVQINYFNNTASGTATLILSNPSAVALLTCAHIVDFPDTIIKYVRNDGPAKTYVKSIAFKEKQTNYISELAEGRDIEILLLDRENDVAIVGRQVSQMIKDIQPVLNCPLGKARDLKWGNFVYLMGFPRGNKMISSGLVSDPNRGRDGGFLVDTPFNRGFSGGIVLAIRDGVPNFELVGIAKSSAAEFEHILKPPEKIDYSEYDDFTPYDGEMYIENKASIQYGVTNIVPIETVIRIIRQNTRRLNLLGYDFSQFLEDKK